MTIRRVLEGVLQYIERNDGRWPKRVTINPSDAMNIMPVSWNLTYDVNGAISGDKLIGMEWFQDETTPVGELRFA